MNQKENETTATTKKYSKEANEGKMWKIDCKKDGLQCNMLTR